MKNIFLILISVLLLSGKTIAQCDANFIPSFFEPLTNQQVNFFYWGSIAPDPDWEFTIDYGNGNDDIGSFPLTYNNLGNTTYTSAGTYTVELVVYDLVCTTSYSTDIIVANATGGCLPDTLTTTNVSACVDIEIVDVFEVVLNDPINYPLDHIEWDMGDGNIIITSTTSLDYTYTDAGVYFVTAKVFVQDGATLCERYAVAATDGPSGTIYTGYSMVSVNDGDPEFTMSPTNPVSGNSVTFTYTGDYSLLPPSYSNSWQYTFNYDASSWNGSLTYGLTLATINPITTGSHTVSLYLDSSNPSSNSCRQGDTITFYVPETACDTCNSFRPIPGERYWLSAWVQEDFSGDQVPNYDNVSITLDFVTSSGTTTVTLEPTGEIIDGWQRIAGEFTIPSGTFDLEVNLNAGTYTTYFDDIRIHPFNGSMKSYVYDGQTFWLVAELDDNNYATIYEYDAEGGLIRIKKETAGGIVTIQETRSSTIKVTP